MFVISSKERRLLLLDPFTLTTARVFKVILSKGKIIKNNKTVLDYLTKTCEECIRRENKKKRWPRNILTRLMLQLLEKEVVRIDQVSSFIQNLTLTISIRRFETMARKAELDVVEDNDFVDVEDVFDDSTAAEASDEAADTSEKPKKPRQPRLKFPKDGVITLNVTENPKRAGSKANQVFSLYHTGMTVEEFLAAGGTTGDLNWDTSRGFISVTGVVVPEVVETSETVEDETSSTEDDASVAL